MPYYKPNDHVTNQLKYYLDNLNIKHDLFNYDIYINPSQNQNVTDFINRYIYPNKFVVIKTHSAVQNIGVYQALNFKGFVIYLRNIIRIIKSY